MKAFKNVGNRAKSLFSRLRGRSGRFAFMGGKTKKAPKGANKMVVASQRSREAFMSSATAKARKKQAMQYALKNPRKVLGFGMNKLFGVGGKGRGVAMGSKNAFSTLKANLPQGLKDGVKSFAQKHNMKGKANTAWQVTKTLAKDPVFMGAGAFTAVYGYQMFQQASKYDKESKSSRKPNF